MNYTFEMTDPAVLLKATVGDKGTFRDLSYVFLRIVPQLLSSLEEALAENDLRIVAERAHALKGCVLLVGGQRIGHRLQALEHDARFNSTVCSIGEFHGIKNDLLRACDEVKLFVGL